MLTEPTRREANKYGVRCSGCDGVMENLAHRGRISLVHPGYSPGQPAANLPTNHCTSFGESYVLFQPCSHCHPERFGICPECYKGRAGQQPCNPGFGVALQTILFTDVDRSTALTQRLGDSKARELLQEHERLVRGTLRTHGGSEVKTMGDGFITSFSSAAKALESAIAIQRAFAQHSESAEELMKLRVGLHAREPIAEEEDLLRTAVADLAMQAKGGGILGSHTVRGLVAGERFPFSDRGETALRGFDDPVRLYELRWREAG